MTRAEYFILGIVLLEAGAALSYFLRRQWADGFIWLGVASSNVAWIWKMVMK